MIKLSNLSLPLDGGPDLLRKKAARLLGLRPDQLGELTLVRQSIDARDKHQVRYVCSVLLSADQEEELVHRAASKQVSLYQPRPYAPPTAARAFSHPPVVVGMGPAGLFAALTLARAGVPPIVLERGRPVEERTADVERFWAGGPLAPGSNVQFGEGGAGTFSDGKLTTGINDPRIDHIFRIFVTHGAPGDILWSHKPHIGTDVLRRVVVSLRRELLALGCDLRFGHQMTGLAIHGGRLTGLQITADGASYALPCEALLLAPGHSARDTFSMLLEQGVPMEAKPFAIGVRIEHSQAAVSQAQYGPAWTKLPPSDYKLACHLPDGRSAFTFCVCPGGQVVAAASEPGRLVTNGMSCRARDGGNINGGFLVGVSPSDFGSSHPLAGIAFQQRWEEAAFTLGGGGFRAPVQTVGDFLAGQPSVRLGTITPTYRPGVMPADLRACLPPFVTDTLAGALPIFDRKLHGFAHLDAVLTGVETRSSSPVRILRGADLQSPLRGLYPCGEGAGWAGGITSAAVDGIKAAEAVLAP